MCKQFLFSCRHLRELCHYCLLCYSIIKETRESNNYEVTIMYVIFNRIKQLTYIRNLYIIR